MKSFFSWVRNSVPLAVLYPVVLSLSGCGDPTGSAGVVQVVAVAKVTRQDLSRSLTLTAEFKPYQEVDIHAKVTGYIQQINVDVGDHADQGAILAQLEIPELQDDLKRAEAALLSTQQEIKSLQATVDDDHLAYTRLTSAAKEAPDLIAQQDLDTAQARDQSDTANLQSAQEKVVQAQADLDRMQAMVEYAKIVAPFDGVVTRRYADTGALIQAGTSGVNSLPIVSFAEEDKLRLEFPVPESSVAEVKVGQALQVHVLSLEESFPAAVSRLAQKVDTATRTMLTEVDVDNPQYHYTPGMYATVQLILAEKKNTLSIPIQALSGTGTPFVLVVNEDHKVEQRTVTVGLQTATEAEVLDGLSENELVIVGNRSSLQIGQEVEPKTD